MTKTNKMETDPQPHKLRITESIDPPQLASFLQLLFFTYRRSNNQNIARVAKSLFHLLNAEKYDSVTEVEVYDNVIKELNDEN